MRFRQERDQSPSRTDRRSWRGIVSATASCCVLFLVFCISGAGDCRAASIPAWLDDAITEWNEENPSLLIRFVDIKDSYVWYTIPHDSEIGSKEIRESIHGIVLKHGYKFDSSEELVTTGKPPSPNAPYKSKKCWTRTFVLNIEELSNTTAAGSDGSDRPGLRQRVLTALVCEDPSAWFAGFRILQ